MSAMLLIVKW